MSKRYLAGIDVGTTGVKAVLFDLAGRPVSSGYEEYACSYPQAGWVEQDCEDLIQAVYRCCERAVRGGGIAGEDVYSIGVSAQRSSTVFMSRQGKPLKLISWLDNRAGEQVEEITQKIGRERFYEITGLPLTTTWMLPKILHTRQHDPALWEQVGKITQLQDMIQRALGVNGYHSDEPEAGFFGLWDNRRLCYSDELLSAFDLSPELLPEIKPVGTKVGEISRAAADRTGFAPGTPICVGIGDQNSAAVGAGLVQPGLVSVSLGTGGLATVLLEDCYRDPQCQAMVTSHAIRGMWTFEGLQNAAAGAFRWFRDEIAALEKDRAAQTGGNVYDVLNRMIENTPLGANGLLMLPYFAGSGAPRWNPDARGGFLGLTLSHSRADMARACVEGITLEQKDILRSIAAEGPDFSCARIVGGATNSEVWNQIQADMYGIPCETLLVNDAAALGAAVSAGVGIGVFSSIAEGASYMVRVKKRYEPIPANTARYEELYQIYTEAYEALDGADLFRRLTNF